ncbi:hypothetical protein KSS87_002229 [Heliosperma pusillum]|nr:hypothetical protein KSS87_002229 [Heliosperma pusillum]
MECDVAEAKVMVFRIKMALQTGVRSIIAESDSLAFINTLKGMRRRMVFHQFTMGSGSISKHKKKRSQSQKHSKKRSRRNKDKSKKPKRRHDSVSCSEEDSKSNSLLSCSNSEDEYRGRKRARSQDRKDRKDRKKRVKRGNSVCESSGDDSPIVKKRKKSKTSKGSETRKKRHGKKRKRSPSVSSLSGRSMSHSSCERSGGSEGEEVKERKGREKGKERKASKRREKGKKKSSSKKKLRSRSRSCSLHSESNSYGREDRMAEENNTKSSVSKRKHRSKSRSPRSWHSESHSYDSEDRMVVENNTKRLKSIIVVVREIDETEIKDSNWDGNKAEIVFEHDEYPSRSNDSNDAVIRREASSLSHDVSSGKLKSLDDSNREIVPCDVQISEIPESQSVVTEKTEGINLTTSGSGGNGQLKGNGISSTDDLAAVLRQKALENFLKRQVKSSAKNAGDKKGDLDSEPNSSSSLKTDQAPHTSAEHSGLRSVQKSGKGDEVNNITELPKSSKADNNVIPPKYESGISRLTEKYTAPSGFADSRTKLGLSSPRKEFIGARNTWRRQPVSQTTSLPNPEQIMGKHTKQKLDSEKSSQQNLPTPNKPILEDSKQQFISQEISQPDPLTLKNPADRDSKRQFTSQEVSQPNLSSPKVIDLRPIRGSGSSHIDSTVTASQPSDIVEHGADENTNETDGDSQFQQKTMSVMRGGEMVQVSYKVYIPNKAPALARRQLKR